MEDGVRVEEAIKPSTYQEFADCFSFLKKFGEVLSLPEVTLLELEQYFLTGM